MLIECQGQVGSRNPRMPDDISVEEIDKILEELENSLDVRTPGTGASVFEIRDGTDKASNGDASLLRFECPTELWEDFTEYCKRNELDPAQQIREAVLSYYKNMWQTYKIRKKLFSESELI